MNIRKSAGAVLMALTLAMGGCSSSSSLDEDTPQDGNTPQDGDTGSDRTPNFVTVVIDDMGFSDLEAFGGEIPTPNINQLALNGIMLNNFYAAPTSTPSRAMLFTGKDHHQAGVGNMRKQLREEQIGQPGYEGELSLGALPFPELLQQNGYHTMLTGKWDLGSDPEHLPSNRGFNETRPALEEGGDHYSLEDGTIQRGVYFNNGVEIEKFPREFYSSDYYTDMGIEMLRERDKDKPFYLCMTYTAPHTPLQAPAEVTAKYLDVYAKGWDVIRAERFKRQKQIGLWPADAELPPRFAGVEAWDSMSEEEQMVSAKKMAIYAAMVDVLDENVGRLIDYLKEIGEYENTVIFLYSDNGGGFMLFTSTEGKDNSYENMGNRNSVIANDLGWAMVQNTPFNRSKNDTFEGGWHTNGILHYPMSKVSNVRANRIVSVMDIAPTILEMAEIAYPDVYKGSLNTPLQGISMANMFEGEQLGYRPNRALAFEMNGMIGVRAGDWKLSRGWCDVKEYYLFNLSTDPFELNDLTETEPDILKAMLDIYDGYAKENGVIDVEPCYIQ
ncbi:arylsulfatase [Desulfobacterales bacterium HSG17]|nr:arylsulfatase [Desulfobacterales bacterium HSG17]